LYSIIVLAIHFNMLLCTIFTLHSSKDDSFQIYPNECGVILEQMKILFVPNVAFSCIPQRCAFRSWTCQVFCHLYSS